MTFNTVRSVITAIYSLLIIHGTFHRGTRSVISLNQLTTIDQRIYSLGNMSLQSKYAYLWCTLLRITHSHAYTDTRALIRTHIYHSNPPPRDGFFCTSAEANETIATQKKKKKRSVILQYCLVKAYRSEWEQRIAAASRLIRKLFFCSTRMQVLSFDLPFWSGNHRF